MIFEKGRQTHYDFYICNTLIDIVDSFKYFGMTLFKNGNCFRSQKCLAKQASFALYNVFTVTCISESLVDIQMYLKFRKK